MAADPTPRRRPPEAGEVAAPNRPGARPPSWPRRRTRGAGAGAGPERGRDHDQRPPFTARKGELVIAAAERAGDVHPTLLLAQPDELGRHVPACACRGRQRPRPAATPTCMVTVAPDMKVDTESATTKRAQEGILELLLANHPLDCPVCDKGGECPLQDQAFSHGPGESRYVEEKRHFEKPIPISDLVLLDRERCILCDRCTRFADEVAGDPLISFTAARQRDPGPDVPRRAVRRRTSPATRCRSARSARSPPRRTGSRPGRGTSSRSRARARRARRLPHRRAVAAATSSCATSASTPTRQLELAVRPRPLQLRGRRAPSTASTAPLVRGEGGLPRRRGTWRWTPPPSSSPTPRGAAARQSIAVLGGARGTNEDAYAWAALADAIGIAAP